MAIPCHYLTVIRWIQSLLPTHLEPSPLTGLANQQTPELLRQIGRSEHHCMQQEIPKLKHLATKPKDLQIVIPCSLVLAPYSAREKRLLKGKIKTVTI